MDKIYDLAVIGSGPAGYNLAIRASQLGMNVIIFEKNKLGGTCLNVGCIPTKTLLKIAIEVNSSLKSDYLVNKAEGIDFEKINCKKNTIINNLRNGISLLLEKAKVDVVMANATVLSNEIVIANDLQYHAKNICLATGSNDLEIFSFKSKYLMNSTDFLNCDFDFENILVIGGGVIGVETAEISRLLQKSVTIIETADRLLNNFSKDVSKQALRHFKKQHVDVLLNTKVTEISESDGKLFVTYQSNDKICQRIFDRVLVAIGRKSNSLDFIDLVEIDTYNKVKVDENFMTNQTNLYAIGDLVNDVKLAHYASNQAHDLAKYLVNDIRISSKKNIPSVVYLEFEIATVGMVDNDLDETVYSTTKLSLSHNALTMINDDKSSYIKLIYDKISKIVVGAEIVSKNASDMISEISLGIENDLKVEDFKKIIRPHPSHSESISEAFDEVDRLSIHTIHI